MGNATAVASEAGKRAVVGKLLKVVGVIFGLAVIVGNTIGGGILRTPANVAIHLPTPWLFIAAWLIGGCYALLGSNSVAELGAAIPKAGGQYAFAIRALGKYAGFVVGWSDALSTAGAVTAVAIVFGEYLPGFVPALTGHTTATAAVVILVFGVINWRGIVWGGRTQEVTTLLKAVAFAGLIIACFVYTPQVPIPAAPAPPPIPTGISLVAAFVIALQGIIYTYDGWTGVIYFSEEVKEPGRDIPRAMFGGVLVVMAIYILLNCALLYVLPIGTIATSEFPAALAAKTLFGDNGDTVIRLLALVTTMSCINACQMMTARTLFGMSRDGLFHHSAERVNRGGTPSVALWMGVAIAIGFLYLKEFDRVAAVMAFFYVVNYTISFLAVFILRRREPNLKRPFRAWGHPYTTGLALIGSIAFLVGAVMSDKENSPWAVAALAVSYPIYRVVRATSQTDKPSRKRRRKRR